MLYPTPFPFVLIFLQRFYFPLLTSPKRWFIMTPLTNYLSLVFCKTSPAVLSLSSPCLSFLYRASALWLLPSCISSSWRPSAGCWQRRGSPTWLSLAKWGHDSFASVFCASAGVSSHSITHDHKHGCYVNFGTLFWFSLEGRSHQNSCMCHREIFGFISSVT